MAKAKKTGAKKARKKSLTQVVSTIMKGKGEMRLKDIVAKARASFKRSRRTIAKRFDGMVYHAVNAVATRTGKGTYRLGKKASK